MSDSNRVQLRYIEEVEWGTIPSSTAMQEIRTTGESLSYNISNTTSAEIRDDRQVTQLVQTGAENGGGINFELSYATFDDFMEGALWSDWTAALSVSSSEISCEGTGTKFVTTVATDFASIATGQWIEVRGFTLAANNGYFQVTSFTTATCINIAQTAADEVKGDTITIGGSMLRNGTTEHSYAIERRHTDIAPNVYFAFAGMVVNTMSLSVQAQNIISGSFDFMGKSATVATAAMSSGSVTDANTNDILNAVSNVAEVKENGTDVSSALVQGLDFSVSNNVRGQSAIGTLGFSDIGVGQVDVTGSLNAYFRNKDLYAKYIASTGTTISFKTEDSSGNAYIFSFPNVEFESDTVNAGSSNSDVMENISWRALRNAAYECTIQIDKFAA